MAKDLETRLTDGEELLNALHEDLRHTRLEYSELPNLVKSIILVMTRSKKPQDLISAFISEHEDEEVQFVVVLMVSFTLECN